MALLFTIQVQGPQQVGSQHICNLIELNMELPMALFQIPVVLVPVQVRVTSVEYLFLLALAHVQ